MHTAGLIAWLITGDVDSHGAYGGYNLSTRINRSHDFNSNMFKFTFQTRFVDVKRIWATFVGFLKIQDGGQKEIMRGQFIFRFTVLSLLPCIFVLSLNISGLSWWTNFLMSHQIPFRKHSSFYSHWTPLHADCSFSENDQVIKNTTIYILTKILLVIIPDGSLTCTWTVKI